MSLLPEIEKSLGRYGLSPNKTFGQNFLLDETVLDAMLVAAAVSAGDVVIEVGPGVATLTRALLSRGARVFAVEKDERFRPLLEALAVEFPNFSVQFGDALQCDFGALLDSAGVARATPVKIVANIPYYATGKLVQLFIRPKGFVVSSVTLLVQKEVAHNMLARAGRMNLLGLSVQLVGTPQVIREVPARSFFPAPKVDSAVVHVVVYAKPLLPEAAEVSLFTVAKACFSGKRKQIHNSLSAGLHLSSEQTDALLASAQITRDARPQNLSVEDFIRLAQNWQQ